MQGEYSETSPFLGRTTSNMFFYLPGFLKHHNIADEISVKFQDGRLVLTYL